MTQHRIVSWHETNAETDTVTLADLDCSAFKHLIIHIDVTAINAATTLTPTILMKNEYAGKGYNYASYYVEFYCRNIKSGSKEAFATYAGATGRQTMYMDEPLPQKIQMVITLSGTTKAATYSVVVEMKD
jgi:hypothetical protein